MLPRQLHSDPARTPAPSAHWTAILVGLFGLALLSACDLGGTSSSYTVQGSLFPLASGNKWVFVSAENDDTSRVEVLATQDVDGRTYHAVSGLSPDTLLLREGNNGRIYRRTEGADSLWLDPSETGQSVYTYRNLPVHVAMVGAVVTPAGAFDTCVRFRFDDPQMADEEYSLTFKPGVGLVQQWGAWTGRDDLVSYLLAEE